MKTTILIAVLVMAMLAVSLVAPMVAAQEDDLLIAANTEDELSDEVLADEAGITPASPFYGLERAMERIRANLAFNKEKSAELELRFADERVAEAAVMARANNTQGLERALEIHERNMQRAQEALEAIESDGDEEAAEEDLAKTVRIQNRIEAHLEKVEAVKARILEGQATRMTEEQLAQMEQNFNRIIVKAQETKAKAEQKQENVRTKYKVLSEKTDEEVDAVVSEIRQRNQERLQTGECDEECIANQIQTQAQNQTQQQAQDGTGPYHDEIVAAGGQGQGNV